MKIAIGYDYIGKHSDGQPQSFSSMWKAHADAAGIEAEVLDPLAPGAIDRIAEFDGFIWRYNFRLPWTDAAPRLIAALETATGMPVWPARVLRDMFENKVAQAYMLDALDIPRPRSWVFWRERDALAALDDLPLPLVAKLSRGVKSDGVALIRTKDEARALFRQMFSFGTQSMDFLRSPRHRLFGRYTPALRALRSGGVKGNLEQGYVMLQEFLAGNDFDTRLVVQGDCVAGSRRLNRAGDFRASGSGMSDFDAEAIHPGAVRLALDLAERLGVRSLVVDILQRDGAPVMGEFSYTMAAHVVAKFQGHWRRTPDGIVRVEQALDWPAMIFDDFVAEVRAHVTRGFPRPVRAASGPMDAA